MADLKLIFVLSCAFALFGLSQVEAKEKFSHPRAKREVEATEESTDLEKVQRQLTTAFDSLKKSMEELASKFNTEDIVQGVQNLTSKLEGYIKQTADQFASTATKTQVPEQPQPEQPQEPSP